MHVGTGWTKRLSFSKGGEGRFRASVGGTRAYMKQVGGGG